MSSLTNRREFLSLSGKAGLGVYLSLCGASFLASSCATPSRGVFAPQAFRTGFQQDPLPYAYNALTEAIDSPTMELHYAAHARSYANNLQEAAKAEGVNTSESLEVVIARISRYSLKMRNNGGGHYNHEMFWKCMSPSGGGNPSGRLATAIDQTFGSFEAFKNQMSEAGNNRFGSGWAWLYMDNNKRLLIGSTPNQDNPLMDVVGISGFPLLGLDVWEHAYYLRYQNKRADYIQNWWKVVNWEYVQSRYEALG